jgi:tRNA threonylcarbamoyladenosine biosynthesis protein TsaE
LWLYSRSPEATRAAGRLLAVAFAGKGGSIALCGDLGAGKTLFVKGLAEGLGVAPELVSSPTFVIANEYPIGGGRVLAHVDLYRVKSMAELEGTGFLDWLAPGNVVAVEWADRLPEALPAERLTISFERVAAADSRRALNAIASGPGAQEQLTRWREALSLAALEGLELAP